MLDIKLRKRRENKHEIRFEDNAEGNNYTKSSQAVYFFYSYKQTNSTACVLLLAPFAAKVTFKVICNGAIRWATYDFLLVFHCHYVSILHR